MRTRSQTLAARKTILDLPPEIFAILEAYLEIRELGLFILTCKTIKRHIERFLYKKVFICRCRPTENTQFWVTLLRRRPEIVHWVHKFVINEYDLVYFPQLLQITFPNLENLILQHDGFCGPAPYRVRKLHALMTGIKPQPSLLNLTFSIEQAPNRGLTGYKIFGLHPSEAPIFRHPNLRRIRLSYLDLTVFDGRLAEDPDYFCHSNVREVMFERCKYSATFLQHFLRPCRNLAKLTLYQDPGLLFPVHQLPAILDQVKGTLRVLKLLWNHLIYHPSAKDEGGGMDFRAFPNLHAVMVHPRLLFGRRYKYYETRQELSELIRSKLPPNLMILALEGVVPNDPEPFGPVDPINGDHGDDDGVPPDHPEEEGRVPPTFVYPIPDHDIALMRHVLQEKEALAPQLEWLVVYYLEHMQNIPRDVLVLAREKEVRCCELYQNDEIAPPIDMEAWAARKEREGKMAGKIGLRKAEEHGDGEGKGEEVESEAKSLEGCCTHLEGMSVERWPKQAIGNY